MAFNREKNYYDLLNVILTKMMELTNADAGTLYVVEDELLKFRIMKTISFNIYKGADDMIDLPPIMLGGDNIENISAYAAIKNELVNVDDVYESSRFNFSGPKKYDKLTGYRTKSMMVFPLSTTESEVIGVIQLINAMDRDTGGIISFTNAFDTSILLALASASANALANILYAKEIDELFQSFVRVMTAAIDERSAYNVNHTNNVAKYCGLFAEFLTERFPEGHEYHFSENRQSQLVMAAFLHDIGKIITPLDVMDKVDRLGDQLEIIKLRFDIKALQLERDYLTSHTCKTEYDGAVTKLADALSVIESANTAGFLPDEKIGQIKALASITYIDRSGEITPILSAANIESLMVRKGTLTESEREIMQQHAAITYRLLDNIKFNKSYRYVPKWASSHHEYLDGTGYPWGLRDEDVELEMCILSIIDIFDALTAMDRPYKKAMPPDRAHKVLLSMADEGKLHREMVEFFVESAIGL